jgi:hypothetical protein
MVPFVVVFRIGDETAAVIWDRSAGRLKRLEPVK